MGTTFDRSPTAQKILDTSKSYFGEHVEFSYNDVADVLPDISRATVSKWLHDLSSDPQFGIRRKGPGVYEIVEPWIAPESQVMTFTLIRTLANGNDLVENESGELFLVRKVPI